MIATYWPSGNAGLEYLMVVCGHFERRGNRWEIFFLRVSLLGVTEVNKQKTS